MNKVAVKIDVEDKSVMNAISLFMTSASSLFSLRFSSDIYSDDWEIGVTLRAKQKAYEIYNFNDIAGYSGDGRFISENGLKFAYRHIGPSHKASISQKVHTKPAIDFFGPGLLSGSRVEVYDFEDGEGWLLNEWAIERRDPSPFEMLKLDIARNGTAATDVAQAIMNTLKIISKERFDEKIERGYFTLGLDKMRASTGVHLFMYLADALNHTALYEDNEINEYEAARMYGEAFKIAIDSGLVDKNFMHEFKDTMTKCFITSKKTIDQCCKLICLSRNTLLWSLFNESVLFRNRFELTCKSKGLIKNAEYATDIEDFLGEEWKTIGLANNEEIKAIESMIIGERIRRKTADSPVLSTGSRKIRV